MDDGIDHQLAQPVTRAAARHDRRCDRDGLRHRLRVATVGEHERAGCDTGHEKEMTGRHPGRNARGANPI